MSNMSFPYPVLGLNDDIIPGLAGDCVKLSGPQKTISEYEFNVLLKQENAEITQLIAEGKAAYACEIECSETFFRKCVMSATPCFDVVLGRRDVRGHVNFDFFVVVTAPIPAYTNAGFNEDYQGFTFSLEKGDLLVRFGHAIYNTEIKYDKLFAAGSFMQIRDAGEIDHTGFTLAEDQIMIEMPHNLFEQYQKVAGTCAEAIHSSIVHNALVYALCNLEAEKDTGKKWVDSLLIRMKELNQPVEDLQNIERAFEVADKLLQDPYKRMLDSLEKFNGNEDPVDEDV